MPTFMWIVIAVFGPAAVGALSVLLFRMAPNIQQVKVGNTSFVVHGTKEQGDSPLGSALRYVPDHIREVHQLFYIHYLRLIKSELGDVPIIFEVEDSRFAEMLLETAICLGNGSASAQKIIEDEIVECRWQSGDLSVYVATKVAPRIVGVVRRLVNDRYDTEIRPNSTTWRTRIVSKVQFVDMLNSSQFREELCTALMPFFENARQHFDGCKES